MSYKPAIYHFGQIFNFLAFVLITKSIKRLPARRSLEAHFRILVLIEL